MSRHLKALGVTKKKAQAMADQASNEKNLPLRKQFVELTHGNSANLDMVGTADEWRDQQQWTLVSEQPDYEGNVPPRSRLFFLDETGIDMHKVRRRYGWSKRNEPCIVRENHVKGKNHSVIILIGTNDDGSIGGVLAHKVIVGKGSGTKRSHFCDFLTNQAVPAIQQYLRETGQADENAWLVMDNASIHKGEDVQETVVNTSIELEYQPPYAPTMNPVEQVNAQLKRELRRREHRRRMQRASSGNATRLPLLPFETSISIAITKIKASDVSGYYNQCGYRKSVN